MDLRNIENRLSDLGHAHEEDVDTELLWQDVSRELDKKKRRTIPIWIFIGTLFVVLMGAVSIYNNWEDDGSELAIALNDKADIIANDKNSTVGTGIGSGNQNIVDVNLTDVISDESLELQIDHKPNISDPVRAQLSLDAGKSDVQPIIRSNASKQLSVDVSGDYIKKSRTLEGGEYLNHISSYRALTGRATKIVNKFPKFASTIVRMASIKPHQQVSLLDIFIKPLEPNFLKPPLPDAYRKNSYSDTRWKIGLHIGALINSINLTGISGIDGVAESSSFLKRNSSVSPLTSWEVIANVGYQLNSDFYLVSGLQFKSLNSRSISELVEVESVIQDNVLIEQVIGPDGIEDVFGQGNVIVETKSIRSRISEYQEISIPLLLEYAPDRSVFNPIIGVGLDYSFLLNRRGLIHLKDNEEYDISEDPNGLLSNSLGVSFNIYGGIGLKLSEHASIITKVGIRRELFSHFKSESTISEKYDMVRLLLGVEHQF